MREKNIKLSVVAGGCRKKRLISLALPLSGSQHMAGLSPMWPGMSPGVGQDHGSGFVLEPRVSRVSKPPLEVSAH